MKSTARQAVRVGLYSGTCGLVLVFCVQLAPTRVAASNLVSLPSDAAAILPTLPAPVRSTPVPAPSTALFELTLRTLHNVDLARQIADAGASREDSTRAVALLQERTGADLSAGSDFKLGLGPRAAGGARSIESISVITDVGMERIERRDGLLALAAPVAARQISAKVDGGSYWALRTAGMDPEIAAQAAKLAEQRLGAGQGAVVSAVIGERPARFGSDSVPRLLLLSVEREGQPARRLMLWPSDGEIWVDPDQKFAATSALGRPVEGRVTSAFGARFHPILQFLRPHRGVDFAARSGDPVRAAADGCAVSAGWSGGYGRQVRLVHRGDLTSSYSHLSSLRIGAGQCVRRGELIGLAGATGLATGPHLHFELHRAGHAVDPLRHVTTSGADHGARRQAIAARLARIERATI